jgi:hypothetical protein
MLTLRNWPKHTLMGTAVRESTWLFPTIETLQIFGIISLVGSTSNLDLRLLGWAFREDSVSKLARPYLPWTWAGFAIQVVTGFFCFRRRPRRCTAI